MSLYSIIGTLWLLFWFLSGFWALRNLEEHPEISKNPALPFINIAALFCGPLVLLGLLLLRLFYAPIHSFLERMRLNDGIRMTFRRNGETIPDATIENAAPRAVRRIFKGALNRAVALHAADLLVEPLPKGGALLRIKTDGALRTIRKLSADEMKALLDLTGCLAGNGLDITPVSENTLEFQGPHGGAALRIGMLKVSGGTRLSFHLLQPERPLLTPAELGLDPIQTDALRQFLALRGGLIVIAGDGGSGRSLTLERILDLADLGNRSAILISRSIPVRLRPEVMRLDTEGGGAGGDIALAALQQSPDLLAVDEVNERTVLPALLAAVHNGMLAIAVIRSRNLVETFRRLIALGAPQAELVNALRLVIQLHPLRRLCRCAQPAIPSPEEAAFLNAAGIPADKLRQAVGCPECSSTGYRGRTVAFELYAPGDALRRVLSAPQTAAPGVIRKALEEELSTASVYTAGCRTASLGLTSLAEVAALQNSAKEECEI